MMNNLLKHRFKMWLHAKGYRLERIYPAMKEHGKAYDLSYSVAEILIRSILSSKKDAVVVQIGAFDGKSNDFLFDYLRKFPARALMVEPQPEAFSVLKRNYKGVKGVIFEQAAISHEDGTMDLYRIKEAYHGSFRLAPQLASFNKAHLQNALSVEHLVGLPDDRDTCIESIPVAAITMSSLFRKHGISSIDILQIDTEGFDYEILKMMNFSEVKPYLINFEVAHLSHETLDEAMNFLVKHGYMFLKYGINMLAVQKGTSSVDDHFYTAEALKGKYAPASL